MPGNTCEEEAPQCTPWKTGEKPFSIDDVLS
jgi:hypothetical protein